MCESDEIFVQTIYNIVTHQKEYNESLFSQLDIPKMYLKKVYFFIKTNLFEHKDYFILCITY